MKILITGASGVLGRAIKRVLDEVGEWTVLGLGYSRLDGGLRKVNLSNADEIISIINEFRPDVVIHAAAVRRLDYVVDHIEETRQVNVIASEVLAKEVNKYGGFILYISTDYVFDGTSPPYLTSDKPNPVNQYGLSKLDGEKAVINNCTRYGVLRVCMLYGNIERLDESPVTCLFAWLQDTSKTMAVNDYEVRYPTDTYDFAVVCRDIVKHLKINENFRGIWHWRGNDKLTKYGMMKIMSKLFDLPMNHIEPYREAPKPGIIRPYDTELDCSDLEELGFSQRTPFEEGIKASLLPFAK